jgi:hypothetical protein
VFGASSQWCDDGMSVWRVCMKKKLAIQNWQVVMGSCCILAVVSSVKIYVVLKSSITKREAPFTPPIPSHPTRTHTHHHHHQQQQQHHHHHQHHPAAATHSSLTPTAVYIGGSTYPSMADA